MIAEADSQYETLIGIEEWSRHPVSGGRWQSHLENLDHRRESVSDQQISASDAFVRRTAAIDSGAIESLYVTDRGFTVSFAIGGATWEDAVADKPQSTRLLVEAQAEGMELALDAATKQTLISEAFIRRLHEVVCAPQETHQVLTNVGMQERQLAKGSYKTEANHPFDVDGALRHSYSPVDLVGPEMQRFVSVLGSESFSDLHPAAQAAYAHWGIVYIHPFSDGNGRVARTLASIFLLRAVSVPLLIYSDARETYLDALGRADQGKFQDFIGFVHERAIDAMDLASDRLRLASSRDPSEQVARLAELYRHPSLGNFSHTEVDAAATRILTLAHKAVTIEISNTAKTDELKVEVRVRSPINGPHSLNGYRRRGENPSQGLVIIATTSPPGEAQHELHFYSFVNVDEHHMDEEILLSDVERTHDIGFRITDLVPEANTAATLRLGAWAAALLSDVIAEITDKAEAAMKAKGYRMSGEQAD